MLTFQHNEALVGLIKGVNSDVEARTEVTVLCSGTLQSHPL